MRCFVLLAALGQTSAKTTCCWSAWGDASSCSNYPAGGSGGICGNDGVTKCNSDQDCKHVPPSPPPSPSPAPTPTPPAPSPTPSPTPPPPSPPIFITTVFEGGTEGCLMYRMPSLLRVKNGTLLAFSQCRQTSRQDQSASSIRLKRSHDDGQTWGPAITLPFAADDDLSMQHQPATVYDESTGSIFLFDDPRKPGTGATVCDVHVWRSDDLGVSWSSAANLTGYERGAALATGIQLPNGKLVICMKAACQRSEGDHALWSDDHGLTWTAGDRMSDGTEECQLTQLSNGSLLANSRRWIPRKSPDRMVSISNDEGQTWSAARKEKALSGSAATHSSIFSYGGDLFFAHPEASDRSHLTIRRSRDDGNTWPKTAEDSLLVWAGKSAYSSLGSTADGALAVLWEKDGADLGFAKIVAFTNDAKSVLV